MNRSCENCKFKSQNGECEGCKLKYSLPSNWVPSYEFNPNSIAERAVCEIVRKTRNDNKNLKKELQFLGISKTLYFKWNRSENEPQSYFIAEMAKAGYDVIYILTGVRKCYG